MDDHEELEVEDEIIQALNGIDPTGELAERWGKGEALAQILHNADEFVAGMFHAGHSGMEIATFGLRIFMLGQLVHTKNVIKALKYIPPQDDLCGDLRSYQ